MVKLYNEGKVHYNVLAMEVNEARERGIRVLNEYNRQCPGAVEEIVEWLIE